MAEALSPAKIRRRARILGAIAVVTIALAGAALGNLAGQRGFLNNLNRKAYDLCFELTRYVPEWLAPRHKPAPITIVWIDRPTATLLNKPRMLWPAEFGEVLHAAATGGATKIGLDHFFDYPVTGWDEAADVLFLQAYTQLMAQHIPVILAYDWFQLRRAGDAAVPVYSQAENDHNNADARLWPDEDGVIRDLVPIFWRTFSSVVVQPGEPRERPDRARRLTMRYYGPPHATFTGVSMADVLLAARAGNQGKLREWFNGRIALVGADDALERTPYGMMPNVEVQANAITTIMRSDTLNPAKPEAQWVFLIAAAFLAVLAAYAIRWPFSLPLTILIAAAAFAVVLVAHARGIILPIVPVELAILIGTAGGYGARLQWRDRRRELLESAFAGRVSPDILEILLVERAQPLEGESREVTVMLCNVHGFNVHSEGRAPEAVMNELNEYIAQMTECILRHSGMVIQYAGDRVLAVFGSPARLHDHARRAVVCAMEMLTRMDLLNERRTAADLEQWRIGIGLHTGEAVLGFIGDRNERVEYAVNGDTVTIASRVEGLNKEFGTQILLSMATRDRMGLDIATVWKGARVFGEGKDEEGVYTI